MVSYQWFVLTWLSEGYQCSGSRVPVNPKLTAGRTRRDPFEETPEPTGVFHR